MKLTIRNTTWLAALCILPAVLLAGCASTVPASTQIDDNAITAAVKAKLTADPDINPFNIDVDTREGVVRLSGSVEKSSARTEAERLARATQGVRRVNNEITIGPTTLGDRIDDTTLVARVKARLIADPVAKAINIDVDAQDGVISLNGRVATQAEKDAAGRVARETEGVRSVRNNLAVGSIG